ncbi:MAG: ABC transporter permease [Planctomycetota bacterium]
MPTGDTNPAPASSAPQQQGRLLAVFTARPATLAGAVVLVLMTSACLLSLPWTLGMTSGEGATVRYNAGEAASGRLPPGWAPKNDRQALALNRSIETTVLERIAAEQAMTIDEVVAQTAGPVADLLREQWPASALGTDELGRSLFVRCLLGGSISLGIGIAAATLSVLIGTLYGVIAGYAGGAIDGFMMRIVDIIYGLPYILLVVLLAVAGDAIVDEWISRQSDRSAYVIELAAQELQAAGQPAASSDARAWLQAEPENRTRLQAAAAEALPARELAPATRNTIDLCILFVAIGGVSWLTMARVIRGQVLSLKNQPFMEAARAIGVPLPLQFLRHLLPNLVGPIVVYATLTVPQAILQESFLSFLGIGVKPPLPSWGNLAADGLDQVNRHQSDWWLLLFPSLLLGLTLLALNFVGEGLREAVDPKRSQTR